MSEQSPDLKTMAQEEQVKWASVLSKSIGALREGNLSHGTIESVRFGIGIFLDQRIPALRGAGASTIPEGHVASIDIATAADVRIALTSLQNHFEGSAQEALNKLEPIAKLVATYNTILAGILKKDERDSDDELMDSITIE